MSRTLVPTLLLVLMALAGPVPAAEDDKDAPPKVYTNADLERMYGSPSRRGGEAVEYDRALFGEEALNALLEGEDETLPARRANAEKAYAAARDRVDYLKHKIAYTRNPLTTPVQLTEEDRKAEEGMGAMDKVARAEGQLEEAEAALAHAESVLRELGGTPPPRTAREPRGARMITVTGERDELPED
jgi:hypothetical protein